ncbi:MAG TPA: CHAT domain-containing protein [Steroidobacteraceae bacterium]|jgi:CHAT domain-containing protein
MSSCALELASARTGWVATVACALAAVIAPNTSFAAVPLPDLCKKAAAPLDASTPIPELRKQVEEKSETDPNASVAILCMAIPRVAQEYGEQSSELGWWVGSLIMPMIAYMNQFSEAIPLLEYAQPILERQYGAVSAEVADIHIAYAWIYQRQGRMAESAKAWQRALQIREKFPGDKKIELQKALVGLALVKLSQGDFPPAREALQRAHDILAENGELVSEAAAAIENVTTNLAFREENFADAKLHAEKQIEIEKQLQAGIGQFVPGYVFLAQILERLDDFDASEAASREAIRLAESDQGGPLQRHLFTALTQLAALLNARGRPNDALTAAQQAVEVGEKTLGPDAPHLVKTLQIYADIHRALGHLPEAWHVYERMGRIVEKSRADIELPTLVSYYRGLAALQLDLGNTDDAITALQAGLEAARSESALALQRGYLMATLAEASTERDASQSRQRYGQALDLFATRLPKSHPTILRVVNELCGLDIGGMSAAGQSPQGASPQPPRTQTPSAPSRVVPTPANCRDVRSRLSSTRDIDPALRAAVYSNLSALSETQGDLNQASVLAVSAVSAAEGLGTPDPLWRSYFRAARSLRAQGRTPLAIFFGKRAIAQIERERQYFNGEDQRFDRGFLHDKMDVYRAVADWLMESGRMDEGLEVLQLLKAQELYDFISRDAAWRPGTDGPALDANERTLADQYSAVLPDDGALGSEIERLTRLQTGRITPKERKDLDSLLKRARQAEQARAKRIRKFIASNSAEKGGTRQTVSIDVATLRWAIDHAPPNSAIAVYLLTDNRLRLLIATRGAQSEVLVPVNSKDLQRDIGRFLGQIANRGPIDDSARALYETLARPLDEAAQREKVSHLLLWLDGPLRYVPFGALKDSKGYLADRYSLEMLARLVPPGNSANPATVSASATARPAAVKVAAAAGPPSRVSPAAMVTPASMTSAVATAPSVRGFGVTRAVAGYDALPAMADELCYVVHGPIAGLSTPSTACSRAAIGDGALIGEGFADAQFTADRFKGLLTPPHQYSVLHVGTHFSLRPGNAMRSFLVLGDGSRLMLDTLSTYDFSGLELVTLSACQTAMGGARSDDGREIEGLSAIVQQRGAKQVVASLWRVEDSSTAQLMRAMYQELATNPSDVATALQQAQRSVRAIVKNGHQPYDHPYYWAGFVVSGTQP